MQLSRRRFLGATSAAAFASFSGKLSAEDARAGTRSYHVCLAPDVVEKTPDILKTVRGAGCSHVWLGTFFYGFWPYPREMIRAAKLKIEQAGMRAEALTVPLGHPGDALGTSDGGFPLTPPKHWKTGMRADGGAHSGTSLHAPATEENAKAVAELEAMGFSTVVVDDDYRLAQGPGVIGGCFCDAHRKAFLEKTGFGAKEWDALRNDTKFRNYSPVLKAWLEFTCDELTACFRAQQKALKTARMGIMVMYLGAEKAGVRLNDYADTPFRVGEFHFDDGSFGSVKGKVNELFSVLFHRRFVKPELAYSETTAFPANQLSARNMAAKLVISTFADVRNSMFMSGLTPFPIAHWTTLAPAMKRNAEFHAKLAGHAPRGPFKHYWGEHSRYVGDDNPNALFLAAGVPFEVSNAPASEGWTFLSQQDAGAIATGQLKSAGTVFMVRPGAAPAGETVRALGETMEEIFAFKREILPKLASTPYVVEDKPVVCAWYPTAKAVLLWNVSDTKLDLTLRFESKDRAVSIGALDLELVSLA